MTQLEEVPHRLMRAGRMGRRHGGDPFGQRHDRVDDDKVIAAVDEPFQLGAGLLRVHDQRAVRQTVHQPLDQRDLPVVLVPCGREHDPQVLLLHRLDGAGQDGREVRGIDQRDEDTDETGAAGREAACTSICRVAVLPDHSCDELARLRRDVVPAVQDP
jgi:hypothetical protein